MGRLRETDNSPQYNDRRSAGNNRPTVARIPLTTLLVSLLLGCDRAPELVEHGDAALSIALTDVPARQSDGVAARSLDASSDSYSRILASNGIAIVGLKRPGVARGIWLATRLISRAHIDTHVLELRSLPGVEVTYVDPILPLVAVRVHDRQAFDTIRSMPFIDYIEPERLDLLPQFGCHSASVPTWPLAFNSSGDVIPRAFPLNGVDRAWARGAFGQNITIGIVDTGLSRNQPELSPGTFANYGRTLTYNTCSNQSCLDLLTDDYWYDQCDHGTRIAGAIGAPNNGTSTIGVAFMSNLVIEKAGDSVWSDDDASALRHLMAIRSVREQGARVIEMAFGGMTVSNALADEIRFEYNRTDRPEVLFVGAAGTGFCPISAGPVYFPARMPEVLAVTGVNPDGTREESCCTGPEVRLAAVLEDYEVPQLTPGSIGTLGGTSAASAIVAASAALVWSRYPTLSRSDLVLRLTRKAGVSKIGVPVLSAFRATGGMTSGAIISSVGYAQPNEPYTLHAYADGDGPYSYLWNNGETTPVVTRTGAGSFSVVLTDLVDGTSVSVSTYVRRPPDRQECLDVCAGERDGCLAEAYNGPQRAACGREYVSCKASCPP